MKPFQPSATSEPASSTRPSGAWSARSEPVSWPGRYIDQVPRENSSAVQSWPWELTTSAPG